MGLRTGELVATWHGSAPINVKNGWREDGATHLSCTVEMADLKTSFERAVLDEIQLMTDEERGWAFTQCFLGLPTKELYVCGEEAILPLLRRLCKTTNRELTVKKFERLSPLRVLDKPVHLSELQDGDAIIAFSRRDIFALKELIECKLDRPNSCAVVYGGLPLQHRLAQAEAFNTRKVPFMIASDAIGLGLNLNIGRILFTSLRKWTREHGLCPLDSRLVRQIGGRAGRFSSGFEGGQVGILQMSDDPSGIDYSKTLNLELYRLWSKPVSPYKQAGIVPPDHYLCDMARNDARNLPTALDRCASLSKLGSDYFHCSVNPMKQTLFAIEEHLDKLDVKTALLLAKAPVRHPRPASLLMIGEMAAHLARSHPPTAFHMPAMSRFYRVTSKLQSKHDRMGEAEEVYRALELYKWVALRFPDAFELDGGVRCKEESEQVGKFIDECLLRER
jgi:ATP-dependent RNA helicase SUPV3L1/SUV3